MSKEIKFVNIDWSKQPKKGKKSKIVFSKRDKITFFLFIILFIGLISFAINQNMRF